MPLNGVSGTVTLMLRMWPWNSQDSLGGPTIAVGREKNKEEEAKQTFKTVNFSGNVSRNYAFLTEWCSSLHQPAATKPPAPSDSAPTAGMNKGCF